MDENVAKAVAMLDGLCGPAREWQTIRARLVELEAENERLRERSKKAEALLREISGALSNGEGELAAIDRITAHLGADQ